MRRKYLILFLIIEVVTLVSCKKLVQIPPPIYSITTPQVFADSADATAAIQGIYSSLISTSGSVDFGNGVVTIYLGCSADEFLPFYSGGDQYSTNTLQAANGSVYAYFWNPAYNYIYQCNAILNGLQSSTGISQSAVSQLNGEAKFLRAYMNFYLVNIFGDIPLITTIDYKTNTYAARTPSNQVYQAITNDLIDAQNQLLGDFSTGGGERIRANKWAATALLARVYLYRGLYDSAALEASSIINNSSVYSLVTDLSSVFNSNSTETILQLQINSALSTLGNATTEGYTILPYPGQAPAYYITNQLASAFEPGDNRRMVWLDSTQYSGQKYIYPYKYTVRYGLPGSTVTQYYMLLRLAEQYLIRAECEANGVGGGVMGAVSDLNVIRNRAGLGSYSGATDVSSLMAAILHERQVELFAEWGHRWLDLKRLGQAHSVLSVIPNKQPWLGDYQLLYPIPASEFVTDPSLKQNPGY